MNILLIKYVVKAEGTRPGGARGIYEHIPQLMCLNIYMLHTVVKARESRPGTPKRIYEYIPY